MADPITVDVVAGTYTCPEHPEMGPVSIGFYGDTPPTKVALTHNDDGTHSHEDVGEPKAATQEEVHGAPEPTAETRTRMASTQRYSRAGTDTIYTAEDAPDVDGFTVIPVDGGAPETVSKAEWHSQFTAVADDGGTQEGGN